MYIFKCCKSFSMSMFTSVKAKNNEMVPLAKMVIASELASIHPVEELK